MLDILIGGTSFREIREESCWYVDKTAFIEEFFRTGPARVSLITRPRRFGKTLMMDMLSEFFDCTKDSRALFEGLAIAKDKELCGRWMNQHPVVMMTLKEVEGLTFHEALSYFADAVGTLCARHNYLQDSPRVSIRDQKRLHELETSEDENFLAKSLSILCRALHAHWGRPVIVLIDEYDVPLARAQENGYYQEMADFLRRLFEAAFKGNESLQAAILTGCLRLARESVFSGLDSFQCYGAADAGFADKFGFTSEEVDAMLAAAGFAGKKDAIQEWYDGYCFGDDAKVCCPWDILMHLRTLQTNPEAMPKPYWTDTSGNAAVYSFVNRTAFSTKDKIDQLLAGGAVPCRLAEGLSYDALQASEESFWTLLFMTGYLTKAGSKQMEKCGISPDKAPGGTAVLAIPNKEVLEVFADAASLWVKEAMDRADRTELFAAFWADDADSLTRLLCSQLEDTITFYDVCDSYYHDFLKALFSFSGWKTRLNHARDWRQYLVVHDKDNNRAAAVEIRRAAAKEELPRLLEEAVKQGKDADYTLPLRKKFRKVSLWGMAFCKKTCLLKVEDISEQPVAVCRKFSSGSIAKSDEEPRTRLGCSLQRDCQHSANTL